MGDLRKLRKKRRKLRNVRVFGEEEDEVWVIMGVW